ncbi:hypothetical protein DFH06DRAFT_476018 [Mycena polygramma]|nr:hypothetical protein DFH06DRAFT_476018 [Mycena polygramma]
MPRFADVLTGNRPPTEQEALGLMEDVERSISASRELEEQLTSLTPAPLRGALSPMRYFPAEILGEIFIACRDHDLSLDEPEYETIDPDCAPTVLTQVCSHWRTVALRTPRLWNNVRLLTDAFLYGGDLSVKGILDRSCHAPLSITLASPPDWCVVATLGEYNKRRWLDIVWDCSRRLRHICLDIYADQTVTPMFPRQTTFPTLSSLEIWIAGDDKPNILPILDSFGASPLLRSLTLSVQRVGGGDLVSPTFPLSQLTKLHIHAHLTPVRARAILVRCTALKIATLRDLLERDADDHSPAPDICTMPHLAQFDLLISHGVSSALLDTFAWPHLTSLSIASRVGQDRPDNAAGTLLALRARSQFSLTDLALVRQDVTLSQLPTVLGALPTLKTLVLEDCACVSDALFGLLANGPAGSSVLTHPRLEVLTLEPVGHLHGDAVARAAEYLAVNAGDPDSAFPLLRNLRLYRGGHFSSPMEFDKAVEERMAAVFARGFLVYRRDRWF